MRGAFLIALLVAGAAAFSPEFFQGAETGIFLGDEDQFEDYSCPMPVLSPYAKSWIDMFKPFKAMMEGMSQGKPSPLLETMNSLMKQIAILYSLFWEEYDGGDFCQGLITAKELATIFWFFGKSIMDQLLSAPIPKQEFEPVYNYTASDSAKSEYIQDKLQLRKP